MAVIKNTDDEEQKTSTSGQSSILGGGAAEGAQSSGSGWTNLQTYLSANEGQGAGIADSLTKGTQQELDKNKTDTAAWKKEAEGNVQASTKKDDKGYLDTIKTGDVSKIDDGFGAWKNLSNYWGANDASQMSGYNDAYSQQSKLKDKVSGLQDYDSQKASLQDTYKAEAPGYTQGMGTLDAFIMRGDQSGKDKLQAFQDQNKNVGADFDQAVADINSSINSAKSNNAYSKDAVNQAIAGRLADYDSSLKQRAGEEADKQFQWNTTQIQNAYKNAGLEAPKNVLGYLKQNETDPYSYATKAEIDAINQLAGLDDDAATGAKSRGGNTGVYNIDWNQLKTDIDDIRRPSSADVIADAEDPTTLGMGRVGTKRR